MYSQPQTQPAFRGPGGIFTMARNVEAWLDARGRKAWIAAMILGFVFVWPLGLALLAYMIWSKRMFNRSHSCASHRNRAQWQAMRHGGFASSGNSAFDSYKADMLNRLEEEQKAFEAFLQRLRDAKDKSEFDQFMDDRARNVRPMDMPEPPTPNAA